MAGLWARWTAPDGGRVHSYTILTRDAPEELAWLHDRIPVVLPQEAWTDWLARGTDEGVLAGILEAPISSRFLTHPVTKAVGRAEYDNPDCIVPVDVEDISPPDQTSLF